MFIPDSRVRHQSNLHRSEYQHKVYLQRHEQNLANLEINKDKDQRKCLIRGCSQITFNRGGG